MSSLGVLRGSRERPQRPSPGSEHRELHRAHLPHAQVTRTPTTRHGAGTRRLGSGDAVLAPILVALPSANFSGMGSTRSCHCRDASRSEVGRDQVARLMAVAGIRGVQRRRGVTTTTRRRGADVAPDLVHRVFRSERPNALRVSDLTSVRTTEGMGDVSLVDATRCMIVGWQVASEMTVETILSLRGGPAPPGCVPWRSLVLPRSGPLRCREGGPSVREATRLAEIGAVPSVGQPGERRHRTPESVNAFSRAELVFGPGRGAVRDVSHREAVTVSSFTWWWRPGYRALSETLSRRPEPTTSSGPTRQRTTPPAGKESKVRSLQESQGELPGWT